MDFGLSTTAAVAIAAAAAAGIVLLAAIVIAWIAFRRRRRHRRLQEQFGSEYERAMRRTGDRRVAEQELEHRVERVETFELRPISEDEAVRFDSRWKLVQADFVDQPQEAVYRADALLVELMCARGYADAGEGPENRAADISVTDPSRARDYRTARSALDRSRSGDVSTEELRQALRKIRGVFDILLERRRTPAASEADREPVTAR